MPANDQRQSWFYYGSHGAVELYNIHTDEVPTDAMLQRGRGSHWISCDNSHEHQYPTPDGFRCVRAVLPYRFRGPRSRGDRWEHSINALALPGQPRVDYGQPFGQPEPPAYDEDASVV